MTQPIDRHCPKCGAIPGQHCIGSRGAERSAFHRSRGSRNRAQPAYAAHTQRIESPIEDEMVGAIVAWLAHHDIADADVVTQVPVGPYRCDIIVETAGKRLAVECDGVAYHSSPEAVQHDKRRDRFFVTQGIAVMRFPGADIRRDPRGCAAEVGLWIRAQR